MLKSNLETSPWLHRYALLTAVATLMLIGVGGLVTSHGAGLAVPDWPNTYGYNMFAFPFSGWVGGILYEHSHRLIGSIVGCLTAGLAAWLWAGETRGASRRWGIAGILFAILLLGARWMPFYLALATLALPVMGVGLWRFARNPRELRWLGITALAAVILQGVLGGLRVVWLQDGIGILHATLAQLFFALMCVIALLTSQKWQEWAPYFRPWRERVENPTSGCRDAGVWGLRRAFLFATALTLIQLVLGAAMRHQHAGLAIPDFPLAYGSLWPATNPGSILHYNQQRIEVVSANPITAFQIHLQMTHRLLAVLILAAVAFCAWRAAKPGGRASAIPAATVPEEARAWMSPEGRPCWPDAGVLTRLARAWLALVLMQAGLGAATVLSNKAADVATAHVVLGAISLAVGIISCIITTCSPELKREARAVSRSSALVQPGVCSKSC